MNMQSRSNLPEATCPKATQAQCLRTIAGAPVGHRVRRARQGSFLVLVIGTLALLAVITIVYVALGNQDSRTKAAVISREAMDDVPAKVGEYLGEVIARDTFSVGLDGSLTTQKIPNLDIEIPGGIPEAALRRETDDAPGIAHDPANPAGTNVAYMLTSDRQTIVNAEDARLAFTPWGGLHDWFISNFAASPGVRQDFAFDGNLGAYRLLSSDPYLASTSPTYLNFNASTRPRASLRQNDFTEYLDAPYMQQLDWYSISNAAPDGLFVNIDNLRNNFNAPHDSSAPATPGGAAGIGYGKSLLERRSNTFNDLTFTSTTTTDWDYQPPLTASGNIPGMDDVPFYWTMRQLGAFRPARVSTNQNAASEPTEYPGRLNVNQVSDFKLYQWADADGDGMLDSRWWEMDVNSPLPEDMVLPKFSGNMRWFIASRIVDLSGLINVNFAGDLAASPADSYSFYRGSNQFELLRNFVMPLGTSPGDIDLRRILMQVDSYANYKANPTGTDNAAYDLIPDVDANYSNYDERKAMLAGSMAYASLRLANSTGTVLGLDPVSDSASSIVDGTQVYEDQGFSNNLSTPPQLAGFLQFSDIQLGVGANNHFDAMGRRPWQTMMFPTRPWQQSAATGTLLVTPSFGGVNTPFFNGWLDWSSRRTINYLAQTRKVWNTSTDSLTVRDTSKQRFGVHDLSELLERYSVNNPNVTTPLEIALGFHDVSITNSRGNWEDFVDVLRSNRPLDAEIETYDPITDALPAAGPDSNDNPMRNALRRRHTDVRQYLTTVSGSRPLRSVASTTAMKRFGNTEIAVDKAINPQSLSESEVKINAREVLDLPPRPSDGLTLDGVSPKVESAESAARILFEGYFEGLAPYASLDAAWQHSNTDFNRVRTLFYGYRGAELASLTAATMAVNMVDLADGPTSAPLVNGPQAYNASIGNGAGQLPSQLQPVRPGPSDPRNKPTIRTVVMTEEGASPSASRPDVVEQLDDLTRSQNNNNASSPGTSDALGAMFPTWQAADDIEQPGTALPTALDNLDISGTGKLAPASADVITPVVNVIGIEPQVFLTQVTTMTVYYDNYIADANGYNVVQGLSNSTVKLAEPELITNPGAGSFPTGNKIADGAGVNNSEVLFKVVAFKLTNPFDRDVILGKPMLSDIAPNSVVGVNEPMMSDSPLELVVDASIPRYPAIPNLGPNTDLNFPFRADASPIFTRTNRWAVGSLALANFAGYPNIVSNANWSTGNPIAGQGVIGAFGRGDQIDVASAAFRAQSSLPVDHISDFNYIRFGSRTYMLMSLNEQWYQAKDSNLLSTTDPMDARVKRYREWERPDVLVPTVPTAGIEDRGVYVDADDTQPGAQVAITLNPIVVPAGKTIVAYALSEAPNKILSNLAAVDGNASAFNLGALQTPTYPNDELADGKRYVDLATFMKRVVERQISAGTIRVAQDNPNPDFATDIFNPNGAYWIPMIWEGAPGAMPPTNIGFTPSRLQDLTKYVNPIPAETAIDVDNNGTISPDEARAQRTATLWRAVRQNSNNSTGSMLESQWRQVPNIPSLDLNTDWAGTAGVATSDSAVRRPLAANGGPWAMNSNDYRNDQMQDRLRIPARLDMSVALKHQVNGLGTSVPIELLGTDILVPAVGNNDIKGYTVALWSSVRRPSDPRSARTMLNGGGINGTAGYEFLYEVPDDILPGYCLEAKYWEDQGEDPADPNALGYPMNVVSAWNLVSESEPWRLYKTARTLRPADASVQFTSAQKDKYFDNGISSGDDNFWHGGAATLQLWLGRMHGFALGTATPLANYELEDPAFADLDIAANPPGATASAKSTTLSAAPRRISAIGYRPTTGVRTLRGTIDQKPNATVTGALISENPAGPFELLNRYLDNSYLASGRLTYAELTPQVSQDADHERGNQSNNFYRDVDMRTSTGNPTTNGPGNSEDFNEDSNYTRWVSTLRSADLLRPLGVGPLEAPAVIQGGNLVLRSNFQPRATTAFDIQNNNARYTTLGEALACALGYENRDYANTPNSLYANQETRDINLLRSPYKLPGEPIAHAPFHLKPPPGALTGALGGAAVQAGDDSSLTLLFDRGNLWVDRFVPYVEAQSANDHDCVMNPSDPTPELPVGPGLPAALMALEQFETPPTDPQALEAIAADNKVGLSVARQGQVNVNTAPVEVLRSLPGLAPRQYVIPSNVTGAGNPRPSTFGFGTPQLLGDFNWFAAVPNTRPLLPINQNTDIAAGIAAYRDMTPVLMSRSALENAKLTAPNRATGTLAGVEPVAVPFLTPDANNLEADPFFNARHTPSENANVSSNTQIPGINKAPGLRSTAELLAVRSRSLTQPNQYVSRWPSGDFNGALANPATVVPRHNRWKAAPWDIDQLGYDTNLLNVPNAAVTEGLNSSFGELDGSSSRSEYPLAGIDNPYKGVPVPLTAQNPSDAAMRNVASEAIRGVVNEYDEQLIAANNVMNTVTNRSDVFAVWFVAAGYQRSDVEGLEPEDPLVPSVQRRFLMIVDRSNVVNKGEKPRILLMKEVPMDSNVQ